MSLPVLLALIVLAAFAVCYFACEKLARRVSSPGSDKRKKK